MTDPLEQIRSICLSSDDLYREMLHVAQALMDAVEGIAGRLECSIIRTDPLWLRALLEHADAGRVELSLQSGDSDLLIIRYGSELAQWWTRQLAEMGPTDSSSFPKIELREGEWHILRLLRKSSHKATLQDELASQTRLSRTTLGNYLDHLRSMNLVHRPRGERGGESLTDAGRRFIEHHDIP